MPDAAQAAGQVGGTINSMFQWTVGAFDYDEIQKANPIVAPMYFLMFQL